MMNDIKIIADKSRKNKTVSIFDTMTEEKKQNILENIDKFKDEFNNMYKNSFAIYKDKGVLINDYCVETMYMQYYDSFGVSSYFNIEYDFNEGYFNEQKSRLTIKFVYKRFSISKYVTNENELIYKDKNIQDRNEEKINYLNLDNSYEYWIEAITPNFNHFAELFKEDMGIYSVMLHDYLNEHEKFEIACSYSTYAKNDFLGVFKDFPYEFMSSNPELTKFSVVYNYSKKKFDKTYMTMIKFKINDTARLYLQICSNDTEYIFMHAKILCQKGDKVEQYVIGMKDLDYSWDRADTNLYSMQNRFLVANYRNNDGDTKAMYAYLQAKVNEKLV